MHRLSDLCSGRNNNLNLIRLAAAWAVLVSHSFVIVSGDSNDEPLAMWLGVTPGTLAVDAFFFLSGLLVAGSLMNASDYGWRGVWHYVLARLLRIYPAIIIMTVATAVALGYFFSNLEFASFVRHENTWIYILKNITLVAGTTGNLPGVFSEAPFPKVVNASLWTLPWEVRMYIGLLATWLFAYCFGSKRYVIFEIAVASIAVFSFCAHLHSLFTEGIVDQRRRLLFLFFAGSTLWLLKSKVLLSGKMVVALLLILAAASANKTLFSSIYQPILLYILLWVAYVPAGMIRSFNKLGDYSYGTYIYAFPVQQAIVVTLPNLGTGAHILISTTITGLIAAISWQLIEKPALSSRPCRTPRTRMNASDSG